MINCMVSRRLCQSRKPQGPRLVVPETPASTVPEFQKYHPEENVLSNRRFSVAPEGFGGGPFSQQPGMFSLQGITVDGRPTMLEDGDDKGKITQPNPRPNRSNKMLSKHFVAPRARLNRRASLHGCDFRTTQGISVMESDAVLHPKEVMYLQKIALASNEEARRSHLTSGMAHISLDGRIINAVSATSSRRIGGDLGEEEAQAWDCFAPLQRVLIVAVAAAAAASSKHVNRKEIDRLQKAVNAQEDALSLMRRELSNLWGQVATEDSPLSFLTPKQVGVDQRPRSVSPMTPLCGSDGLHPDTPMMETPIISKRQWQCDLPDGSVGSGLFRDNSINKSVLLVEKSQDQLQTVQSGDAKWYSNPLIEHSGRSDDSLHSEHYFEDCTPDKRRRIFSRFSADATEPIEWMSVKSSFTAISADTVTPTTIRKRFSYEDSFTTLPKEKSLVLGEMAAMRGCCSALLVEVKNQVLSVLDKEASQVMAALSHVIEKAQKLEKMDRTSSFSRRGNTPEKKAKASAALKQSVEKASAQVASLQAAVLNIWRTIGPHALVSLNFSPQDCENLLLRVAKLVPETPLNNDKNTVSTRGEGIDEWKRWQQAHRSETTVPSLLSRIEAAANAFSGVDIQAACSPSWKHKGSEIASAIGAAVQKTVDSLMAPLDGRETAENFESPLSKQRVSALSEDAPQILAQQLLEDLEKAAAKLAGMECQMDTLKQSVRDSDTQREKAEVKLAEAIARDHENQEKFEREMNELTTKLREKESAYDELMRSRKTMFLAKSKEIAELKRDCQRRDMALDGITAAAQATREASDQRLAVLEDICKRKDSAIQELKEEIIALEDKVYELELRSPLLRDKARRGFSLLRSSAEEALALEDRFNGICRDLQARSHRVDPSKNLLPIPCSRTENFTRLTASTTSLPNREKEGTSSARPLALSVDGSMFPSPIATLFDDFLEVESSLQTLEADDGFQLGDEFCTPSNGDSLRRSQEYFSVEGRSSSGLKQLKNMTIGSRPESAGSNTKVTKSQRARGNAFFTSTDENKKPSGLLRPTKASLLKAQGKGKVVKREKEVYSESQQEEINWVSAGVLASMEYNGSLNGSVTSRRTSNSSTEIKESIGKTRSRENKPIRRTRWL
ncbi:uncharacterized protein [Physcomitrium patens]|uniref:Uncharacterized protein n=1 Tax=Physcomitrium patens TaxID=3218 RepID=A0A7I4C1Y8_PHYPA|nr:uncharacterized protein LOC112273034 isoform X2 [Physcomitrium patens]|eukprot:XP_024357126.1 uncharacterized protein LOC112273034 isoform X2 [Physcomitrella patens]